MYEGIIDDGFVFTCTYVRVHVSTSITKCCHLPHATCGVCVAAGGSSLVGTEMVLHDTSDGLTGKMDSSGG